MIKTQQRKTGIIKIPKNFYHIATPDRSHVVINFYIDYIKLLPSNIEKIRISLSKKQKKVNNFLDNIDNISDLKNRIHDFATDIRSNNLDFELSKISESTFDLYSLLPNDVSSIAQPGSNIDSRDLLPLLPRQELLFLDSTNSQKNKTIVPIDDDPGDNMVIQYAFDNGITAGLPNTNAFFTVVFNMLNWNTSNSTVGDYPFPILHRFKDLHTWIKSPDFITRRKNEIDWSSWKHTTGLKDGTQKLTGYNMKKLYLLLYQRKNLQGKFNLFSKPLTRKMFPVSCKLPISESKKENYFMRMELINKHGGIAEVFDFSLKSKDIIKDARLSRRKPVLKMSLTQDDNLAVEIIQQDFNSRACLIQQYTDAQPRYQSVAILNATKGQTANAEIPISNSDSIVKIRAITLDYDGTPSGIFTEKVLYRTPSQLPPTPAPPSPPPEPMPDLEDVEIEDLVEAEENGPDKLSSNFDIIINPTSFYQSNNESYKLEIKVDKDANFNDNAVNGCTDLIVVIKNMATKLNLPSDAIEEKKTDKKWITTGLQTGKYKIKVKGTMAGGTTQLLGEEVHEIVANASTLAEGTLEIDVEDLNLEDTGAEKVKDPANQSGNKTNKQAGSGTDSTFTYDSTKPMQITFPGNNNPKIYNDTDSGGNESLVVELNIEVTNFPAGYVFQVSDVTLNFNSWGLQGSMKKSVKQAVFTEDVSSAKVSAAGVYSTTISTSIPIATKGTGGASTGMNTAGGSTAGSVGGAGSGKGGGSGGGAGSNKQGGSGVSGGSGVGGPTASSGVPAGSPSYPAGGTGNPSPPANDDAIDKLFDNYGNQIQNAYGISEQDVRDLIANSGSLSVEIIANLVDAGQYMQAASKLQSEFAAQQTPSPSGGGKPGGSGNTFGTNF